MLLSIYGARAQEESLSISKNLWMNCRAQMRNATYIPRTALYGYRVREDGELEIVPEKAEVVQRIFDSFLSGMGKCKIADMLNAQQVPKRLEFPIWHTSTIDHILKNQRYMGDAVLQKTYMTDTLPFRKKRNKGEVTRYYVENANPPIISREQFEAAQRLMEESQKEKTRSVLYPLTGKIHCSCGRVYTLVVVNGIRYWECHARNQKSLNCDSRRIPEKDIENAYINTASAAWTHSGTRHCTDGANAGET